MTTTLVGGAQAPALISEARDLETQLPYPPEHSCGPICEDWRAKMMNRAHFSNVYRWCPGRFRSVQDGPSQST